MSVPGEPVERPPTTWLAQVITSTTSEPGTAAAQQPCPIPLKQLANSPLGGRIVDLEAALVGDTK